MAIYSNNRPAWRAPAPGRRSAHRNERLADAMKVTGMSFTDLASAVGIHYKTAQRWVYEGRIPQTRDRALRAARLLGIEADWLWPRLPRLTNPDLVNVYDLMTEVSPTLWHRLAHVSTRTIEIASDSSPVLPDGLDRTLKERAEAGVDVRLCLGQSIEPAIEIPGVSRRRSAHGDMISIYRFDGVMLVWHNRGGPAMDYLGPVMHLRRVQDNGLFDAYTYVFARLWGEGNSISSRH